MEQGAKNAFGLAMVGGSPKFQHGHFHRLIPELRVEDILESKTCK